MQHQKSAPQHTRVRWEAGREAAASMARVGGEAAHGSRHWTTYGCLPPWTHRRPAVACRPSRPAARPAACRAHRCAAPAHTTPRAPAGPTRHRCAAATVRRSRRPCRLSPGAPRPPGVARHPTPRASG
eukprot:scaffold75249_cov63-Phaeocystis_antarctica.AAC.1